jgi:hypothetical protein
MKKARLLILCMFIPGLSVWAQNQDQLAVAQAVRQLNQAMIDADRKTLVELASERLNYGHSSWLIEDKDAFITAIIDGKSGFITIDLTEQTIDISHNVAIVRHKFSADTDNKGQPPAHINLGVLQVWQKEKGKWLLLARQATRLP